MERAKVAPMKMLGTQLGVFSNEKSRRGGHSLFDSPMRKTWTWFRYLESGSVFSTMVMDADLPEGSIRIRYSPSFIGGQSTEIHPVFSCC